MKRDVLLRGTTLIFKVLFAAKLISVADILNFRVNFSKAPNFFLFLKLLSFPFSKYQSERLKA